MFYNVIPNTEFINKYKSGNVIIEPMVDNTTQTEAKSPSLPNFTAIIAPLAALGIAKRKKIVYLIVASIGKNATKNMVRNAITTNFIPVVIYAHLSVNS